MFDQKVEPLAELGKICQKPNYKTQGNWMERHVLRDAALYITWALLHTRVTAHQVTVFLYVLAIASCLLLATGSAWIFLAGAVLLGLWYLLDQVDGQLARYRKTASPDGMFLDFMMHHLVDMIVPFSVGFGAFQAGGGVHVIVTGFIAALSLGLLGIMTDCRAKTVLALNAGRLRKEDPAFKDGFRHASRIERSPWRRVFAFLHKTCETYVVLLFLILAGVFRSYTAFVYYYAAAATLVWVARLAYWVNKKCVSTEPFFDS